MSILVSGSLVYDNIMNFPDSFRNHILPEQVHILNVCFMVDRVERSWGGTAGNIAYSMRLLGGAPIVVSAVGTDGGDYLDHLRGNGINIDNVVKSDKQLTAGAYITTDADDNQITAFYNGPLDLSLQTNVNDLENITLALISPTHKEVMKRHLKDCHEAGIKTVLDLGQQLTAFNQTELRQMIEQSDFIIGNDYEMKLLQQKSEMSASEIADGKRILITTLGEKGSVITTAEGEMVEVGACAPKSLDDPTGAGDAFRAGFFVGYELGYSLKTCGQMGSVAASYAIESYGTQAHKFSAEEFCQRYESVFKEKVNLTSAEMLM